MFDMRKRSVRASGPGFIHWILIGPGEMGRRSVCWGRGARKTETELDSLEKQLRGVFTVHALEHGEWGVGWGVACINRPDLERCVCVCGRVGNKLAGCFPPRQSIHTCIFYFFKDLPYVGMKPRLGSCSRNNHVIIKGPKRKRKNRKKNRSGLYYFL